MDHGLPPRRILPPPVPPAHRHTPVSAPEESAAAQTPDEDETRFIAEDLPQIDDADDAEDDDLAGPATGSHRVLVLRPSRKRWIPAGAGGALAAIAAAVVLSTGMLERQAPVADEAAVTEAAVPSATATTPPPSMPTVPTLDLAPGTPGAGAGGPATGRSTTVAAPSPTQAVRPAPVTSTPSVAAPPPATATASTPVATPTVSTSAAGSSSATSSAPVESPDTATPATETTAP